MTAIIWILVAVVLIGGAVALVLVGMRYARQNEGEGDPLMARLAEASSRAMWSHWKLVELAQPFAERGDHSGVCGALANFLQYYPSEIDRRYCP